MTTSNVAAFAAACTGPALLLGGLCLLAAIVALLALASGERERSPSRAHPAAKAVYPEPEPFDADLWEARYAAAHAPDQRGRQ